MTLRDEVLGTLRALEGPFASVGPHVGLEVACFRELLQAFFKGTQQNLLLVFGALHFLD